MPLRIDWGLPRWGLFAAGFFAGVSWACNRALTARNTSAMRVICPPWWGSISSVRRFAPIILPATARIWKSFQALHNSFTAGCETPRDSDSSRRLAMGDRFGFRLMLGIALV